MRRIPILSLLPIIALAACGSDDPRSDAPATSVSAKPTTAPTTSPSAAEPPLTAQTAAPGTEAPATSAPVPTTEPPSAERVRQLSAREIVEYLASDELGGRDNGSPGSELARSMFIGQLSAFAAPLAGEAAGETGGGYLQTFSDGTNILAVIPGGDLKDEYVMVGGHYDHLGTDCTSGEDPADTICNGATDNATGAAAVIAVGRAIAEAGTPRRSVILALWDAEEDGLLGSQAYAASPLVPLRSTKAYVNFDIQGSSLLPSLRNTTVVIGAETGGAPLIDAVDDVTAASSLDELRLSLLFGQGRSDHAVMVGAGVPSVFFSDANNGCYHRANDDLRNVDWTKFEAQVRTATALTEQLVGTDTPPVLDPSAPPTTFEDAVSMLRVLERAEGDRELLPADARAPAQKFLTDLRSIVTAGDEAFGDKEVAALLGGSVIVVDALSRVDCTAVRG